MKKFCVFCGKPPHNKNNEHVIPRWLIGMTGDPKRNANFGPFYDDTKLEIKQISFDKFVYPACYSCNKEFGEIEGRVKPVIIDLLSNGQLDSKDFNLLLTWFDKIRIGSALASLYQLKNLYDITPNYYINDGVTSRDRMLLIYKSNHDFKCLNVFGIGPFIVNYPICIGLIVNNYGFINIASSFLLHRYFGLPFPKINPMYKDDLEVDLCPGPYKTFDNRIIEYHYDQECTEIFQPIINNRIRENPVANFFYGQCNYDKIFINKTSLLGKIFYANNSRPILYPNNKSATWIPKSKDYNQGTFQNFIAYTTLKIQNSFLEKGLSLSSYISQSTLSKLCLDLRINNIILNKLPILHKKLKRN